jgi:hypothetical protein
VSAQCECGAAQRGSSCACGILQRSGDSRENYYDGATETWRNAAQTLAADNARLCAIALAADKLLEAADEVACATGYDKTRAVVRLRNAAHAYKIARQGQ